MGERLDARITVMITQDMRTFLEQQAMRSFPADIGPVVREALDQYRTNAYVAAMKEAKPEEGK